MRQRGGHEAKQGDEQSKTVHLDSFSLTKQPFIDRIADAFQRRKPGQRMRHRKPF